ncbi:ABC transporter ATP-binding protein [Agromyces sp. Root81]|uniref:ABC transporter ATP-binding protein n=1 Tax=Agromyces sp. Root81 TaxID=1736601 RepID=UPI00138F5765|nr:ABC transporter ATP-binding protein [Agromyces sp. Root81]
MAGRTLSGLLDVAGVFLIGIIATIGATQAGAEGVPLEFLGVSIATITTDSILWLVLLVLVVFVGKSALAIYLSRKLAFHIAAVETRNAREISEYLLHGSLDDAKRFSKAEFQFAVTGSTSAAFSGLLNAMATIVSEGFLLVVISIAFFLVDPVAAFFAIAYFVGIALTIQGFIGRVLKRAGRDGTEGMIGSTNVISDSLDSFRELAVMGKQDFYIGRLAQARAQLARSSATFAFMGGMPRYIIETALIVGVVALVAQQFLTNGLATGVVVLGVFLTGGMRIMASLLPLQNSFVQIKVYLEQANLAQSLLRETGRKTTSPSTESTVDLVELHRDGLPVFIDKADFAYPGEVHNALDQVSIEVPSGSFAAIIGPSGAGKTTLVDLLLGLVMPDQGTVSIGPATPLELRYLAPGLISYVPQKPGMVSGTIAENIAIGHEARDIDRDRLRRVIEAANLAEFIDSLPEGADTSVGKQVNSLSGGQIQRIGLARALYTEPRLLIMDEATSALDAGSEAFISASLRKLHGHVTVVVIAHRLSTVQHADNVYVMEDGRVTANGDFKTLTRTVPMVAQYVKLMAIDE